MLKLDLELKFSLYLFASWTEQLATEKGKEYIHERWQMGQCNLDVKVQLFVTDIKS